MVFRVISSNGTWLVHYYGRTWNAAEISRSMSLLGKTTHSYLDILTGTFMIRQLQSLFENMGKRQKSKKSICDQLKCYAWRISTLLEKLTQR